MSTIRQLIQTGPAKANELFSKLVDTSDTAVKTRERLFSELKTELEQFAKLEELHLFPALRKHKGTKDLAVEALADNKETRKLLAELGRTPKDSEDFVGKVTELRKVFQAHVRDEKKELLPAVLKALSDEEAEAIVVKIEDAKAEIEATKRAGVEQRRADTRREREEIESVQQAAEEVANTVRASAQGATQMARAAQETAQSGVGTVVEMAQRSTEQLTQLFGVSGQQVQEAVRQASENMQAVAQSHTVLVRGFQEVSQEWFGMTQNRVQKNLEGLNALASCRSVQDLVAVQSTLLRDSLQLMIENSRGIAEVSMRVADKAARTIAPDADKNAERRKRAA